jgi:TP901 family phage tail tape measure protein
VRTIPDYDLGTARGNIEVSASTLSRAIAALDTMGNKMLLVGVAAGALFVGAIKSAADFQSEMSRFGAVSNATKDQLDAVSKKALQLGRDSAYGATEVARAFSELAYAGASAKEIVNGLGDATVYLAAAGEIPLEDASRTLINTMRQFHIPAKGAVDIANELARAANASTIDIADLNTSLRYAGPVAAVMGIKFRDVAQALAILGNEGIRGSTAGTSLRGVMLGLTAISAPAKEALHTLGLDTNEVGNNFYTAQGKMRSFKEISELLRGAMGDLGKQVFNANGTLKSHKEITDLLNSSTVSLTDKTKLEAFAHLFQRRAMASAFALAHDGAKAFDDLSKSQQYNTTAQELMRKKLDNLKGSFKILKSSIETMLIVFGTPFLGVLKQVTDALRDLTNWFAELDPDTQKIIMYTLLAAAAFFILFGIVGKTAGAVLRWSRDLRDAYNGIKLATSIIRNGLIPAIIDSAVAFFSSGWGAIVIAIALIVLAIAALWIWWDKIKKFLMDNKWVAALIIIFAPFIAILIAIVAVAKWVQANWTQIWNKVKEVAKAVWDWLKQAASDVSDWVQQAWKDVVNFFKNDVVKFFENLPSNIQTGLEQAGQAVLGFIKKIPDYIQQLPQFLAGLINDAITWLSQMGANMITGLMTGVAQGFTGLLSWLIGTAIPWIWQAFANSVVWLVTDGAEMILGFFFGALNAFADFMTWVIGTAIPWIFNAFVDAITWLVTDGFDLLQGFWNGALDAWNAFIGWVGGLLWNILQAIGSTLGTLVEAGWNLIQGFLNGAINAWNIVFNWFYSLPGTIARAVGDLWDTLANAAGRLFDGFIHFAKQAWEDVKGFFGGIADDIASLKGPLPDDYLLLQPHGQAIVQGLMKGIRDTLPDLYKYLEGIAPAIDTRMNNQFAYVGSGAGAGGTAAAAVPTSSRTVMQQNTIYAWDAREAAMALEQERAWAERTAGVA